MTESAKLTYKFLHSISSRLSGRADCRKVEYVVSIGMYNPYVCRYLLDNTKGHDYFSKHIEIYPEVRVFPDRYTRKESLKIPIVDYIIKTKLYDDLYEGLAADGSIQINCDKLVSGIYKYKTSFNGKYRKWIRVR